MRLAECLNQSDIGNLRKIAQRHALGCALYSKNSLLQEILSRFSEPSYIAERVSQAPDNLQKALQEIALDGRDCYAREELLALLRRAFPLSSGELADPNPSLEDVVMQLLQEGMIYEAGSTSRRTYVCPSDVWKRVHRATSDHLRQHVQSSAMTPSVYRDDGSALARDAITFLLFARKQELRLTQDGVVWRRQQAQVLQLMEVREDPLPQTVGWRFGFGRRFHDYPDRMALIYDHLYDEGCLIESPDGRLLVDSESAGRYMQDGEEARSHRLFRYWLHIYRSAIPNLRGLAAQLAELCADSWVYARSLEDILLPQVRGYYYETSEQLLERRLLQMMVHLGVLMKGQQDGGAVLYRLSKQGAAWIKSKGDLADGPPMPAPVTDHAAIIQPTFEILVPPEGDTVYGWDLQLIANLVKSDRMHTYALTRDSIYRALQSGWDEMRIVDFLSRISAYPVPGNVEHTLRGWCKEYGKVIVANYCVVTCRDSETAAEVGRLAPLSGRILAQLGECSFAFAMQDQEFVASLLQRLGYLVQCKVSQN